MKKVQVSISLPEIVLKELESHIDGLEYRSRAHIIHNILVEWLNNKNKKGIKQTDIFENISKKNTKKKK